MKVNPKRPLTQRWPSVIDASSGDVTFTMAPCWTWSVSVQPTPQYGQIVSVLAWAASSHVPAARISCSERNMSAPVGQTPMQLPQYTQAEAGSGVAYSVEMWASNPRPATEIANVFCASTPHASTHL